MVLILLFDGALALALGLMEINSMRSKGIEKFGMASSFHNKNLQIVHNLPRIVKHDTLCDSQAVVCCFLCGSTTISLAI